MKSTMIKYIALRFQIARSTDRSFLDTIIKRTPEVIADVMKTKHPRRAKDTMEKRLLDLKARAEKRLLFLGTRQLLVDPTTWKCYNAGVFLSDSPHPEAVTCKCSHRAIFHADLKGKCNGNFYDDEGARPCTCDRFEEKPIEP